MVHVRMVDGEPVGFGNAGALYMNAMTWWDHKTLSIWSQPVGRAISGPLRGTQLELLPAQIVAWKRWQESHPNTLVLANDLDKQRYRHRFRQGFVIGVALGQHAKAFPFETVAQAGVVNDAVGDAPVLIWAEEQEYQVYFRRVQGQVLVFGWQDGMLVDQETGTHWDPRLGLAQEGPLAGEALQAAPSLTSYDWAWRDFYPHTEIYGE